MFESIASHPFIQHIEAHFQAILKECSALSAEDYLDWPVRDAYAGSWRIYPLYCSDPGWSVGASIPGNRRRCPEVCRLLEPIEGLALAGFSRIEPGTHIYPHVDSTESLTLRSHLGLFVHHGAEIRAGDQRRTWEPGKCLAFLSSTVHEAVNRGPTSRTVFLVDVLAECAHLPLRTRAV